MSDTIKAASDHLRGAIAEELAAETGVFGTESTQLLKFHGIYQQDDRDQRRRLTRERAPLAYSCMVRCSIPGGVIDGAQWAAIDRLADEVADGALRLTTRQGVQYHFVHQGDLRHLITALSEGLVSTYGACGDVVRNVMATTAPVVGHELDRIEALAHEIDTRFTPRSQAYWELWIDGERAITAEPRRGADDEVEPIYGDTYLPRKFKIGIAAPGDNSIDVYSQDCGIVLADGVAETGEVVPGAVILAGGGLGRSHNNPETFPHLGLPLCWVPDEDITDVVEAVVTVFRGEGDRDDRKHARLKYLVAERGIDWLRTAVEHRLDRTVADPIDLAPFGSHRQHLGWHSMGDDRWFLGIPVMSGRLTDTGRSQPRAAIRAALDAGFASEIRLTPHQDLLLCGISAGDRPAVRALMTAHGVRMVGDLSLSVVSSMACPALPTCGQALGEAERVLPDVTDLLDRLLAERDLCDVAIETRMTGCPNGCSRPYVAELGIVGRTKTAYDLWLGGSRDGTRLAVETVEAVPFEKLGDVLGPLLDRFRMDRDADESFGDWANRIGPDDLRLGLPSFSLPGRRS